MYTEEEQLAQIRDWLKRYGKIILIGLVLVVLITVGWRFWQNQQHQYAEKASILYDHLLVSYDKKDKAAFEGQVNYLLNTYANSIYAQMGALLSAKEAIADKAWDKAIKALQWGVDHGPSKALSQLASLHLARIYLFQQQYDNALKALSDKHITDPHYLGQVYGLRGDIELAKGDRISALHYYDLAIKTFTKDSDMFDFYELKRYQVLPIHHKTIIHSDRLPVTASIKTNTTTP